MPFNSINRNLHIHTIILYIIAIILFALFFLNISFNVPENYLFALELFFLIGAIIIAIIPSIYALRIQSAFTWKNAVQDINATMGDVLAVRKEYKIVQSQLENINNHILQTLQAQKGLTETAKDDHINISENIGDFKNLLNKIEQKLDSELSNLRNRENNWVEKCVEYVEAIDQQSDNEDLSEGYRKSLIKSVKDFGNIFDSMGFKIINPQKGEQFDDLKHQSKTEQKDDKIKKGLIIKCQMIGFIQGENIIKKAEVIISAGN